MDLLLRLTGRDLGSLKVNEAADIVLVIKTIVAAKKKN